jgi:NIMA (never in mitosis gene a)-related kinase
MSQDDQRATFREAKILEVLNHPNIVRFREVYRTKAGQLCIVMDYADGKFRTFLFKIDGDLAQKIKACRDRSC